MNQIIAMRRARKGFTLIELLVVILILGILMAVAMPLYFASLRNSERVTCRSNLQTIANAVHATRVRTRAPDYSFAGATFDLGDVTDLVSGATDLQVVPTCPRGGQNYGLAEAGGLLQVTCNNPGAHGTWTLGQSTD